MLEEIFKSSKHYRIMLVIPSLRGGGAERVAVDLGKRWVQARHEVIMVTQSSPESDVYALDHKIQRVNTKTFGLTGAWGLFKKFYTLRREIKHFRPDVVIGFMTSSSVISILAAQGLSCKVIATEHAYPPAQKLTSVWLWLRRKTYPKAAKVITLTEGSAQCLQKTIPLAKYAVIPNAVHWPLENKEPKIQLPKQESRKWLLSVGRLHHEKGFDLLIQAFALIANAQPDWDLIIVGEGEQREKLTSQIVAGNLQQRVYLPGQAGNMQWWYGQADMFVVSSRSEGLSNALLEAMSSGLPCVSFDCENGPREIIRENIDGVLVRPAGAVDELAQALKSLINNRQRSRQYALRAVDARDRFSMQSISRKWDEVFEQVITNNNNEDSITS